MSIKKKEIELSEYLEEWICLRYPEWNAFYNDVSRNRRTGIYLLQDGERLLDLFNDIMGNIEDHFSHEKDKHLIPANFSSIGQTLRFLSNFNNHLQSKFGLLEKNLKGADTNYIVVKMAEICQDISEMVLRCNNIYLADDSIPIPYMQSRDYLYNHNVHGFIDIMKSLIKGVPYNIHKEKISEGYFHTIFHVISSVIGLSPVSEKETSDGRIDVKFNCPNYIYIIEFKYSDDNSDRSFEGIAQIKKEKYDLPDHIKGKEIIGIGVSFGKDDRNINGFVEESLYKPNLKIKTF